MMSPLHTYEQALTYLYGFFRGPRPPTPRGPIVRYLSTQLGIEGPLQSARVAHITGTNGKGSTCAYLEALLCGGGHRTIALTSPHCNSMRERIRIDGTPIDKITFLDLMRRAYPVLEASRDSSQHPTPTTIVVLLALMLHDDRGESCFGIYEVGAGGEQDATNVFARAVVGLTRVAEDHIAQFGGTLETLLSEKLGLVKPQGTLVHLKQAPALEELVHRHCQASLANCVTVGVDQVVQIAGTFDGVRLDGSWQAENVALAWSLLQHLPGDVALSPLAAREAVGRMYRPPGRLEVRTVDSRVICLDGAHNVPALQTVLPHLARSTSYSHSTAIVGFSRDKEWQRMLDLIAAAGQFATVITTECTRPRGVSPKELASYARSRGLHAIAAPSLRSALSVAFACDPRHRIVILGSLLLIADFDKALHALGLSSFATPAADIDPVQPWMAAFL